MDFRTTAAAHYARVGFEPHSEPFSVERSDPVLASLPLVKIRNTFLTVADDDELAKAATRTCPPSLFLSIRDAARNAHQRRCAASEDSDELPSIGSTFHAAGQCKPCGWFWKRGGCHNGRECRHCHLCPDGVLRSRRKIKDQRMREAKHSPAPLEAKHCPALVTNSLC